jgi:hypothetical protein
MEAGLISTVSPCSRSGRKRWEYPVESALAQEKWGAGVPLIPALKLSV